MGHDSHQNKILALGIALILAVVVAVATIHDADVTRGKAHTLRVREAPPRFDGVRSQIVPQPIRHTEAAGRRLRVQDDH